MRCLAVVTALVLWSNCAAAQDAAAPEVRYNTFGVPEQVVREIASAEAERPAAAPALDCNDAGLLAQVRGKIDSLQPQAAGENVVERRRRLLSLKHIGKFRPLSVADFVPRDNYRVANRMIYVKINEGLKDSDLRLCVSDNPVLDRKVYLLMYRLKDEIRVEIINYTAADTGEPFIIYKK